MECELCVYNESAFRNYTLISVVQMIFPYQNKNDRYCQSKSNQV